MTDPFTFDESRVRIERAGAWKGEDLGYSVLSYTLPDGSLMQLDNSKGSEKRRDFALVKESDPAFYRRSIRRMRDAFIAHVATLSAHQRLTWLAAAQQENPDVPYS